MTKRTVTLTVLLTIAMTASVDAMASRNMLKNGSLEIDVDADGIPDGWSIGKGPAGKWKHSHKKQVAKFGLTDEIVADDKFSFKVETPTENEKWEYESFRVSYYKPIPPVEPDSIYTLSMKLYNKDTIAGQYPQRLSLTISVPDCGPV